MSNPVTVYHADGRVELVKAGHFRKPTSPRARYKAYLRSPEWKALRRRVFARDDRKCQRCGTRKRLVAHHLTYVRFGHERLADLLTLCSGCHDHFHKGGRTVR